MSVSMAIVDFIPVILFLIASYKSTEEAYYGVKECSQEVTRKSKYCKQYKQQDDYCY